MSYTIDRLPYHMGELLMVYADREYVGKVIPQDGGFRAEHFCYEGQWFRGQDEAIAFIKCREARYQLWRQSNVEVAA